ncbi:ATP-binding protein [Streptomyces sp. H27-C3]|uniref:ATP-binding protein n=1 Tax=unclassified Streptomyces TaxID=2593676 RepID=UPI0024BB3015|nr:ATP-binding protein [Streptomyces sp. H27-C3]MDJ0466046.1 ATP-binding protein [Streptomyces sp. H27-C3]
MTTTTVRPRRGPYRDGDLMRSTFDIRQRPPGELPPPADGEKVGVMRRRARERLSARGLAYVADEAVLIVSELVTNAIVHSGGQEVTVTLSLGSGFLRIDVHDGVPSFHAHPKAPDDADENGRGLALVQSLAEEGRGAWGVEDAGATTWCKLRLAAS